MQGLWNYIDHAPVLDLIVAAVWFSIIAGLLIFAAITVYRDVQYAKKRKRLLKLAEGSSDSPPSAPRQGLDEFTNDHPGHIRVGLDRRGR